MLASCTSNDDTPSGGGSTFGKADLIIKNAKIFTSDQNNPQATALVVKDGKFVYVGNEDGLAEYLQGGDSCQIRRVCISGSCTSCVCHATNVLWQVHRQATHHTHPKRFWSRLTVDDCSFHLSMLAHKPHRSPTSFFLEFHRTRHMTGPTASTLFLSAFGIWMNTLVLYFISNFDFMARRYEK